MYFKVVKLDTVTTEIFMRELKNLYYTRRISQANMQQRKIEEKERAIHDLTKIVKRLDFSVPKFNEIPKQIADYTNSIGSHGSSQIKRLAQWMILSAIGLKNVGQTIISIGPEFGDLSRRAKTHYLTHKYYTQIFFSERTWKNQGRR